MCSHPARPPSFPVAPTGRKEKRGGDFISYTHAAPTELRTDVFSTTEELNSPVPRACGRASQRLKKQETL